MMNQLLKNKVQLLLWGTILMIVSIETKQTDSEDLVALVSNVKEEGVCPEEKITLTCSIQNTGFLKWSWGYDFDNRISITSKSQAYFSHQGFNATRTKVQNITDDGIANLASTLTFRASEHLNGTIVNCSGSSNCNASFLVHVLYIIAPPPPSIISHKLIHEYGKYSVYVVEWATVHEAESYEVNVTSANVSISETTSMNLLSFIISSTNTAINFSIRASNCLGYGDTYVLGLDLSQLDNTSTPDSEVPSILIPILSTLCGVFGGVLGTLMIVFITMKLMTLKSRGLEVKQCSPDSSLPSSNKVDGTEYSEVRDSSGKWHTCRRQTTMTGKFSGDTLDTYIRPKDYINWTQLHTTTTASASHGQPNYEKSDSTREPQKNFTLISSRCETQEMPVHQETQNSVLISSGGSCMSSAYERDQATTYEEKFDKQELEINHRLISSRYEMHELPDFRILEQSSEPQAVGGGYTEEQKRRLEYSDLSRNSMYFSLQPCVQKKPPTVPPEPTSENRYSSLHHEY